MYPVATDEQIAFFRAHGYLVVTDAVPQEDLDELEGHLDTLIENKEKLAFDWAWDEKEDKDKRSFRINPVVAVARDRARGHRDRGDGRVLAWGSVNGYTPS